MITSALRASARSQSIDKPGADDGAIPYHVDETARAIASAEDGWNRPILSKSDRAILDIGCGAGQSYRAYKAQGQLPKDCRYVGVDPDDGAIAEGRRLIDGDVRLLCTTAEDYLPTVADATFDHVFSRVSLVYCKIPQVLRGIHRTLKPGGHVWFTLHTRRHAENCMEGSHYSLFRKTGVRLNGWLLKHFGVVVSWKGRYESWQDPEAFVALLAKYNIDATFDLNLNHKGDDVLRVTGTKR